jgi:threonine/homoserine/homoserine lactone efflux protein
LGSIDIQGFGVEAVLGFVLATLALAGSPGPNTLGLAAVGAAFGQSRGLAYMAGVDLGMVLVIAIAGTGVGGLILALPGAAPVITVIAAAYFLYLAYKIATAPPLSGDATPGSEPKWYDGVVLSLVNPKAYAAMAAMFSSAALVEGDLLADGLSKAALLLMVIIVLNLGWLSAGAALTPLLRQERTSRIINIGFAVALLASVAAVMLM